MVGIGGTATGAVQLCPTVGALRARVGIAGAEFLAQSSLRIMPCCRSAGEAAGIAAALALDGKMPARDVDGRKVRKIMEDRGAIYAEV